MHLSRYILVFAVSVSFAFWHHAPIAFANAQSDAQRLLERHKLEREVDKREAAIEAVIEERKQIDDDIQSQLDAQKRAQEKKAKQAKAAAMLSAGLTAIAAVTLVAAQFTFDPGTKASLNKWGGILMLGGMGAGMVSQLVAANSQQSRANASNLGAFDPKALIDTDAGRNSTAPVQLTSTDLRTPPLDEALTQFEANTGIPREDLANALNKGIPPAEFLSGAGGLTSDGINSALNTAKNETGGGKLNNKALEKIADSAGLGSLTDAIGTGSSINGKVLAETDSSDFEKGGNGLPGGGGTSGASTVAPLNLASLTSSDKKAANTEVDSVNFDFERDVDVDPEIQRKLEAKGYTKGSIFDQVHKRYAIWSPLMLGYGPSVDMDRNSMK